MPGVSINLISQEKLTQLSSTKKIQFILNEVMRGKVLVLEVGLTASEEAELIKTTMANIDQDTFIGIEMQSYSHEDVKKGNWLSKLLRRKQQPRMSVIGPADLLKTIHKDGNMIETMILTRETIVGEARREQEMEPPPPAPEGMKSPEQSPDEMEQQSNEQPIGSTTNAPDAKDDAPDSNEKELSEEG